MKAADIMTKTPITVNEDTPIIEVVSLLLNLRISGLPVLDAHGKMTGIVTEGDLLRRSELGTEIKRPHWQSLFLNPGKLARDYIQSHALYTGEIMTKTPLTVGPDTPLDEVISLMENYSVKRVPVTEEGELIGIITRVDILKTLRGILEKQRHPDQVLENTLDDESLKNKILDKLARQSWAPQNNIRVAVNQGVVDLYGTIHNEDLRSALITLVEQAIKSKQVRDHLVYIDPITGLYITPNETDTH